MTRPLVAVLMREIPELTSCLYDLDLLPEQVGSGTDREKMMFCIAAHIDKMRRRLTPSEPKNLEKVALGESKGFAKVSIRSSENNSTFC